MVGFSDEDTLGLNTSKLSPLVPLNLAHGITYSLAILALLYHRCLSLFRSQDTFSLLLFLALTIADLLLAFMWALSQAFRWRPVRRQEFPEALVRAVAKATWPGLDVFVCTADPFKEPPLSVANTVLSALAFDYPPDRLSVYVSDDGCSPLTMFALMEAAGFAKHWVPFCRENDLADRSPEAYFELEGRSGKIKSLYQEMKERVEKTMEQGRVDPGYLTSEQREIFRKWDTEFSRQEHGPIIQILLDGSKDLDISHAPTPTVVYVARGKSRTSPHHFKAGALNALIRVSGALTSGAVVLTLDCDTCPRDSKAAQRALCYFMDPEISSKLAFVQFPQRFRGINKHDIYASDHKHLCTLHPRGMDGFGGPHYLGSACFFSRASFAEASSPPAPMVSPSSSKLPETLEKAKLLAECDYESGTSWGSTTGIMYGSLVEDFNTGYHLMCRGWISAFCDPEPPAFLGDAPITLHDTLTQSTRWCVGVLQMAFSRLSPLVYGFRRAPPAIMMCYTRYAFRPIWCIPVCVYAALPQIALVYQVPLFPKASEAWFFLYVFLFLAAYLQYLVEFLRGGGTVRSWWNDQRMWLTRGVTSNLFSLIQFSAQKMGFSASGFIVTNKVMDDEQIDRYDNGLFEFGAESPFFVSIGTVAAINLVALAVGLSRSIIAGNLQTMLLQLLISGFAVVNCWPVYEASLVRVDSGRMPRKIIRSSASLAAVMLCGAYLAISTSSAQRFV